MKSYSRVAIIAALIIIFIIYNTLIGNAFIRYLKKIEFESQKREVELALVSFYSYYHVWPCPSGPLNTRALEELMGLNEAQINNRHINFFDLNHISPALSDSAGIPLRFEPNNSMGACVVTGSDEKTLDGVSN